MRDAHAELAYYLGHEPSMDLVAQAEEWLESFPDGDLAEWADAMIEIGAL